MFLRPRRYASPLQGQEGGLIDTDGPDPDVDLFAETTYGEPQSPRLPGTPDQPPCSPIGPSPPSDATVAPARNASWNDATHGTAAIDMAAQRRHSDSTMSANSDQHEQRHTMSHAFAHSISRQLANMKSPSPVPLDPKCVCTNGTRAPPKLDWEALGVDHPPSEDRPFLCWNCRTHYTHRAQTCSQMRHIPWIVPTMERDFICIYCWSHLTREERDEYEALFLQKWGNKANSKPENGVQKYLSMMDGILDGPTV